ncbi:MAG: hypothetical protein IKE06_04905 [Solobacterium sp.]|nr:hypothetical protein [Solobacterium sp.]MBR3126727.1 hypothetical protein [Solobacterium sp.]
MNINLYPYNRYILLAAFVVLLLTLIMTAVHLVRFGKVLNARMAELEKISVQAEALQKRLEPKKEKKKLPELKTVLPLLLLAHSIYKDYREAEGSGLEQVRRSAVKVTEKRLVSDHLKSQIAKIR